MLSSADRWVPFGEIVRDVGLAGCPVQERLGGDRFEAGVPGPEPVVPVPRPVVGRKDLCRRRRRPKCLCCPSAARPSTAINANGRILFIILVLLGLLGGTGILGDTMTTIAGWSPVGALLTLFSDVLNQAAWSNQDGHSLLACVGYIVVFSFVGIRWFRWDAR